MFLIRKQGISVSDYPERPRFFAHRFTRLVAKSCLANFAGPEVCWMLAVIVHQEDAKGYRGAVSYFNEQLLPLVGLGSVDAMARVRSKAVASGWLHYQPGGKGRPGLYWVQIPEEWNTADDSANDESGEVYYRKNAEVNGVYVRDSAEVSAERTAKEPREKCGENRERSAEHSSLSLSQIQEEEEKTPPPPSPAERFLADWNKIVTFSPARSLTGKRLKCFDARWRIEAWRNDYPEALKRIPASSFLRGENDRGWRADVDWFLRPDTVTRILEGRYDDREAATSTKPTETPAQRVIREAIEAKERVAQ